MDTDYTVKITYKSGKTETLEIKLAEYPKILEQLTREGRLKSIKLS